MSDKIAGTPAETTMIGTEAPRQDFVGRLGAAARENPAAAALIAMGSVWLFAGGSKVSILGSRRGGRSTRFDYSARTPAPSVIGLHTEGAATAAEDAARDAGQAARHVGEYAEKTAHDLAGRVSSTTREAADAVSDGVGSAAQKLSAAARRTGSAAEEMSVEALRSLRGTTNRGWHEAEDIGRSVREMLEDQPLAIAALSLAAGAGLALALPRARAEQDLMGEQSEALRESVEDFATQGIDDVRSIGDAALATAIRDARKNGISEEAVRTAVEEFTAKLGKVAVAGRDAAADKAMDAAGGQ